jgi:hypothetical protein
LLGLRALHPPAGPALSPLRLAGRPTQTPHPHPPLRTSPRSPGPPRASLSPTATAAPPGSEPVRLYAGPRAPPAASTDSAVPATFAGSLAVAGPTVTSVPCAPRSLIEAESADLELAIPVPEQHHARAPTDSPAIRRPADKFQASPRSIGPHAPRPSRTGFHTPRTAPESYRDPGDTRPDAREPTSIADLSRPTPCVRPPPGLNPTPASRPHPRPDEPRPELSGEGAIERAVMFQAAWQAPGCHDRCHAGSCSRPSSAETPLLSAPSAAIAPCADRQARA